MYRAALLVGVCLSLLPKVAWAYCGSGVAAHLSTPACHDLRGSGASVLSLPRSAPLLVTLFWESTCCTPTIPSTPVLPKAACRSWRASAPPTLAMLRGLPKEGFDYTALGLEKLEGPHWKPVSVTLEPATLSCRFFHKTKAYGTQNFRLKGTLVSGVYRIAAKHKTDPTNRHILIGAFSIRPSL